LALRLALAVTAFAVVRVMPWLTGVGGPWHRLDADQRDRVLARAAAWPGVADLLEVAKLVACFLVFDDERAQDAARGGVP